MLALKKKRVRYFTNADKEYLTDIARLGGNARAKKLSDFRRSEIASAAAKARWAKRGTR